MGKLTYGMNVSVDGYIADTNGDIGWSDPDAELHQYWNDQVRDTAVSLYGRKLYELMSAHWPTADEAPDVSSVQAEFARLWRAMPKVVFSKTLDSVGWNSRLERGDVVEVATRPTKAGDCCLREALFIAADHARKVDPTLAVRYQRLMLAGKHHDSAVCTLAAVLLTRIAACLRAGTHYLLRDTDGRVITEAQGRAIVAERYTVPPEVRAARRKVTPHRHPRRNERNERAKTGVATRSKASPVPQPA